MPTLPSKTQIALTFGGNDAHPPLTMSTREIAALIEKAHSNIKISAERLSAAGVIGTLAAQEFAHNGNTYTEYLLNKRDSLVLVAQNCPEFTARIVDRWQELETQLAKPVQPPVVLSRMDILKLAMESEEARLKAEAERDEVAAQLAITAPKAAFVDQYVQATGLKGFRAVAKLLGAKEPALRAFLQCRGVMYLLGGEWTAYSQHIDAGRFVVKTGTSKEGHAFSQSLFTPKGVEWIAGEWAKHQLRAAEAAEEAVF